MEESSANNENEEKLVLTSEIDECEKGNDDSLVEANKEHSTQPPVQVWFELLCLLVTKIKIKKQLQINHILFNYSLMGMGLLQVLTHKMLLLIMLIENLLEVLINFQVEH